MIAIRSPVTLLVSLCLLAGPVAVAAEGPAPGSAAAQPAHVDAVSKAERERFDLSDFYRKRVRVGEFLILASDAVSDHALLEARYVISSMLTGRDDIIRGMVSRRFRCAVMAATEMTTDIPEHSDLTPARYWDRRARGLGPTRIRPCVSCGEENLLGYPGDPYSTESILVHEFGHAIHAGLKAIDDGFDDRLKATFLAAREKGLWEGKYAGKNRDEYWAEGVQSYFGTNRENDHDHNHVNTRQELREYDPALAELLDGVFRKNPWSYVHPRDREEKGHLAGYDPSKAPRFRWPRRAGPRERGRAAGGGADRTEARKRADGSDAARRPGPVTREIEGWTVLVDPRLVEGEGEGERRELGERALFALRAQLHRIALVADADRLRKLRELEIWIELDHPRLRSMQYHPSIGWLRSNGHDERLAKKVHIPRAGSLLEPRESAKHPWVVLHELAHAYQDRFVGWNDPDLRAAFEKAKKEGRYESVLHVFGGTTRHYALSNHHEYFAEGTESYFGRNDFYPFVRAELKQHDPTLHDFLRRVWGPIPGDRP